MFSKICTHFKNSLTSKIYSLCKVSILSVFSILLAACAAGPALENYPERAIDRPYVVPEGLAIWSVQAVYQDKKNENAWRSEESTSLSLMAWETSLAAGWSLLWYPIPAGVAYQAWNDEDSRLGFRTVLGFSYGDAQGWVVSPRLEGDYRYKFLNDFGFDLSAQFVPRVAFKKETPYLWDFLSAAGPLWQIDNGNALKAMFVYAVRRDPEIRLNDSSAEVFYHAGFQIKTSHRMTRQSTIEPSYRYLTGGNGYRDQEYQLNFLHVW